MTITTSSGLGWAPHAPRQDAALTDPACALSPQHELVVLARRESEAAARLIQLRYRRKASGTKD